MIFYDNYQHKGLRKNLLNHLREKGIADETVLEAMNQIPRHLFFGSNTMFYETYAYKDEAFDIGEKQTISRPHTVARQSELLQIKPGEKILEIGTGSGYQATVLMLLKAQVFSIERQKALHDRTAKFLPEIRNFILQDYEARKAKDVQQIRSWKTEQEYYPIKTYHGDGFEGRAAQAPFDKIIITAAISEMPKKLFKQLRVGGKIVLPFGSDRDCEMRRMTKMSETEFEIEHFETFGFVPMLKGTVV